MKSILVLFLFCVSCIHEEVRPIVNRGDLLFPFGTYRHGVELIVTADPKGEVKKFHFDGIVQASREQIKMTALSPLGTSIFRMTDNLKTGELKVEIFMSSLEKYKDRFTDYYQLLRVLFQASMKQDSGAFKILTRNNNFYPETAEILFHNQKNELSFKDYDVRKVPKLVEVQNPQFKIKIELVDFESEK